jgi:hypothetical protein
MPLSGNLSDARSAECGVKTAVRIEAFHPLPSRNPATHGHNLSVRRDGHPAEYLVDITADLRDNHATVPEGAIKAAVWVKTDQATLVSELPCRHDLAVTVKRNGIGQAVAAIVGGQLKVKNSSCRKGRIQLPSLGQG